MYLLYHRCSYLSIVFSNFLNYFFNCFGAVCGSRTHIPLLLSSRPTIERTPHLLFTYLLYHSFRIMSIGNVAQSLRRVFVQLVQYANNGLRLRLRPCEALFCGAWSFAWRPSLTKTQTYLLYFSQMEMSRMLCMGGGFREKNFFDWSNHFVLSTTILKPFFDFGLRISFVNPYLLRKK